MAEVPSPVRKAASILAESWELEADSHTSVFSLETPLHCSRCPFHLKHQFCALRLAEFGFDGASALGSRNSCSASTRPAQEGMAWHGSYVTIRYSTALALPRSLCVE